MLPSVQTLRRFAQSHFGARRVIACLLLTNWLVLTLGIPLPSISGKDRSQPFPCMDRTCGCRTADQCWRSCCCNTDEEKVAWSREHGVTPPAYVLAAAKRAAESRGKSKLASLQAGRSCCIKKHQDTCRSGACDHAHSPQQAIAASKQTTSPASPSAESPDQDWDLILLSSVQRCQGQSSVSLNELDALPVLPEPECSILSLSNWIANVDPIFPSREPTAQLLPPKII